MKMHFNDYLDKKDRGLNYNFSAQQHIPPAMTLPPALQPIQNEENNEENDHQYDHENVFQPWQM